MEILLTVLLFLWQIGWVLLLGGALWALLIAVHDGQSGGTRRTIEYAMRRGLDVVDIPPVM